MRGRRLANQRRSGTPWDMASSSDMTDRDQAPPRSDRDPTKLNVALLAVCQSLGMTGTSIMMIVAGLAGYTLAEDKNLATVPLALTFVATMISTMPASMLMRHIGRRRGFTIGTLFGIAGGLVGAYAVWQFDFWLLAAGNMLMGVQGAFIHLYRFAAADTASEAFRPKAISLVLAGGVVAAILGSPLAQLTRDWFDQAVFAGCYLAVSCLAALTMVVLQFIRIPPLTMAQRADHGRPLSVIVAQPIFLVAVGSAAIGYGVMSLVMTSTPLAMDHYEHSFANTAWVIQWHALAMFAPSFVTGYIIRRLGAPQVIMIGIAINLAACLIALTGVDVWAFWVSLFLIGLGWNFMFIGGTTLATKTYTPAERNKVQGLNDFIVFSVVAMASLSSGFLHAYLGWQAVVIGVLPLLSAVLLAVLWLRLRRLVSPA